MQVTENSKRKYFNKPQKLKILNELHEGGVTISSLARKHGIHPVTVHKWKREMVTEKDKKTIDVHEILAENDRLKDEIENLKKAVGELAVDKQILKTAVDVMKKNIRQDQYKRQKKPPKS